MLGEPGNKANLISCFVFVGTHHSEFLFVFPSEKEKGKRNALL